VTSAHRATKQLKYGRTDFKQRISCSNGMRLLEFNIVIAGFKSLDWIHVAQDKDQWRDLGNDPPGFIKGWNYREQLSDC
jgi:hypothetical protein